MSVASIRIIDWLAMLMAAGVAVSIRSSFKWMEETTVIGPPTLINELSDSRLEKEAEVSAGSNLSPVICLRSESRRRDTLAAIEDAVGRAPPEKLRFPAEMNDKLLAWLWDEVLPDENESRMAMECDLTRGVRGVLKFGSAADDTKAVLAGSVDRGLFFAE